MAPPAVNATLMGANTLSVFLGTVISGRLGGLYETLTASQFWALHAALVGLGGVLMLLMGARLRRELTQSRPRDDGVSKMMAPAAQAPRELSARQ
jgi:POT family proton-dependent oligopeptide transporter